MKTKTQLGQANPSNLFPARLLSVDSHADLTEDVYLLKPNNSTDSSVEIAVTRVGVKAGNDSHVRGQPIVLLHGYYQNKHFWLDANKVGFASFMAHAGYDVWVMETRGHGLSPINEKYFSNSLEQYACFDIPAVNDFILEQTTQKPIWLGYGSGGVSMLASVTAKYLDQTKIKSLIVIGAQVTGGLNFLKIPFVHFFAKMKLKSNTVLSGLDNNRGVEDESISMMQEIYRWRKLFSGWKSVAKENYWQGLSEINVPYLSVAGEVDKYDSPYACKKLFDQIGSNNKQYIAVSRNAGFAHDYTHERIFSDASSIDEIWPLISKWVKELD